MVNTDGRGRVSLFRDSKMAAVTSSVKLNIQFLKHLFSPFNI